MSLHMDLKNFFFNLIFFLAVGEGLAMGAEAFYLAPSPLVSPTASSHVYTSVNTRSIWRPLN